MKRVLWIISGISIFVAGTYILQLAGNWEHSSSPRLGKLFSGFSAGQARHVQFAWSPNSQYHFTDRERRDQALDWLLLAALSQSGLEGKELMQITFDLPPVRARFIQPIAAFDYGATRSRSLGHGQVLAVVPVEAPEQRNLSLAHIADEHRKDTGRIPEKLLVFEYRLDPDWGSGELLRRADIDGRTLFTETAGYREAVIGGLSSLRDFLASIDDLTYVGSKQGSLVAGGRKLNVDRRPATAMTVDDVAALWQSQKFLSAAHAELDAFNAKWKSKRYTTEAEKEELEAERDREWKELNQRISPERRVTSSGFSLDPTFDYEGLLDWIERNGEGFKRAAGASDEDLLKIQSGLRSRNEGALYDFLDRVHKDKSAQLAQALEANVRHFSFQAARYDGALRGTHAGMTLFYTDLVAKLKALEFWNNAPIDGFRPLTRVRLSPVFKREIEEHSKTRLWFGTQDRGFQASEGQILFARNATRIYAASANTFTPGSEVEPNAESEEFLGWWNNHYEEVARYEPEYDRLNQIMKWSLALTWLNQQSEFEKLGFLGNYNVDHSNWFPDWARKNPHLKYTDWDRVPFYPPHYKGSKTESLPLLRSSGFQSFGEMHMIAGGVSLARDDLFEGRALLPKVSAGEESVLRSGLNYQSFNSGENTVLKTLDNGEHEFQEADILSRARKQAKFREAQAELRNAPVDRRFLNIPGDLRIDIKVGEVPFGRFSTTTTGDTIKIGFEELDFDRAHDVAEEISAARKLSAHPEEILAANRDVQYVIGLDCDGCYAVKLRGSNSWAKFAPEGEPQVDLASGWDSRAGAMDDGAPTINIAMLDRQKITNELQSGRLFVVDAEESERAGAALRISNRGPPSGATPAEVRLGGIAVPAERGPDGKLYIAREHLPPALQRDPDALIRALRDRSDPALRVANELQNGDFDRLFEEIARDPAGTKQQVERFAKQAMEEADGALARGDDALAGRRVEGVMAVRGRTAGLLARKAIADVHSQPEQAVEEIRAALRGSGPIGEDVFRPLNARLLGSDLRDADLRNLLEIANMLDLRRTEQAAHVSGDIVPELRDGIVDFNVRLTEPLPSATASAIDSASTSRPWYVLDNPSLALNDPAVRLRLSMDLHAGHDLGPVVSLPRDDLAHFQPRTIETADGRKWVRLTEASRNPARAYSPYQRHSCAGDQDQDPDCERHPYLVETKTVH